MKELGYGEEYSHDFANNFADQISTWCSQKHRVLRSRNNSRENTTRVFKKSVER
jgi:hypothetical protein